MFNNNIQRIIGSYLLPSKDKITLDKWRYLYELKNRSYYSNFLHECIIEENKVQITINEMYACFKEWFKFNIPNNKIPYKVEFVLEITKILGLPKGKSHLYYNGYRYRTINDDNEELNN